MAALFTTPKRNDKTSGAHFVEPDVCRRTLLTHGSWRRVTRRIVCGLACALTVSSLLMPSVSLAAEWVKVGGNKYNTAASDEAWASAFRSVPPSSRHTAARSRPQASST